MQCRTKIDTDTPDRTGILRDLRLYQNDIKQNTSILSHCF
jgi:hypothetical protein